VQIYKVDRFKKQVDFALVKDKSARKAPEAEPRAQEPDRRRGKPSGMPPGKRPFKPQKQQKRSWKGRG
jgi:hypothetical protein